MGERRTFSGSPSVHPQTKHTSHKSAHGGAYTFGLGLCQFLGLGLDGRGLLFWVWIIELHMGSVEGLIRWGFIVLEDPEGGWSFRGPTVDGRNPAPLGNHGNPLLVGICRESSFQGFSGGAGFRPSTVPQRSPTHFAHLPKPADSPENPLNGMKVDSLGTLGGGYHSGHQPPLRWFPTTSRQISRPENFIAQLASFGKGPWISPNQINLTGGFH